MNMGIGSSANRWRGVVLGMWAVGIAMLLIAGRYSLFIRAQLWPLLLGSLLILLFFLIAMIARPAHAASGRIRMATWIRGAMLLLPLLYMSNLVSGGAASGLNSFALEKRSLGLSSASDSLGIGTDSDMTPTDANKLVSLGYISKHLHRLTGTRVVTDARVFRDETLPAGEIAVYRFVVVCCAADAMPVELVVNSPKTAGFKNDDWIRIGGILQIEVMNGKRVPVIEADKIDPIPAPDEPYLSPYAF
jgi:putative membrane protein